MPIPKPNGGEKEDKYISRCISNVIGEYDVEGQAYAVCKSTYDKDKMSKITDTTSKVMARVAYDTKYRGINLMAKAGDDPCWDGYEMIGMKDDGTPNCVPVKLKEGVPHYTKDGELYEGPTHKLPDGSLMTGETHSDDSEKLYHKEDLAEVGPRGGIKESDKAPKSGTPNKDPKGEGSAKGDASGKSAKVSAADEETLKNKVKEFNEKDSNTKNGNATLGQLKSVFQRGLGAFNTSHSPLVKSASQWAFARVNAFLYLLKNGRPENPKYDTDYDLLPKGHPKSK